MINKIVLIGRLTRSPELRYTPSTGIPVASFNLAVERSFKNKNDEKETDFFNCVVYGKPAETLTEKIGKGNLLGVSGRVQIRSYQGKDGSKKHITEVIIEELQFIEWGARLTSDEMVQIDDGEYPFNQEF